MFDMNPNKHLYFLIITSTFVIFLLSHCTTEPEVIVDPAFIVDGIVLDSASQLPIPGVLVGFRPTTISDSDFFVGDSLIHTNVSYSDQTDSSGRFHIVLMMEFRDSTRYERMYAWKTGYKLWRYAHNPVTRNWINEYTDELKIFIVAR